MRAWLRSLPLTALLALGCAPAPAPGAGEALALDGAGASACVQGEARAADDGCNTCTCGPDGAWRCSDLACAEACAPGDFHALADGCNTCTCTPDGAWQCTTGACQRTDDDHDPDRTAACAPGEQGEDAAGCPCACDADGAWQCECTDGAGGEPPSPGGDGCEGDAVRAGDCGGVCWCADGAWACDGSCDDALFNGGEGAEAPDGDDWAACSDDAECAPTGCGQRVCAAQALECADDGPADACYVGEAAVTGCGCVEGRCAWADVPALAACVQAEAPTDPAPEPDGD